MLIKYVTDVQTKQQTPDIVLFSFFENYFKIKCLLPDLYYDLLASTQLSSHFSSPTFLTDNVRYRLWFKNPTFSTVIFDKPVQIKELELSVAYNFTKRSSFTQFFINNFVDIPLCFKGIPSLKRANRETPLLRFINYMSKQGKKAKAHISLMNGFNLFYNDRNVTNLYTFQFIKFWEAFNSFWLKNKVIGFIAPASDKFPEHSNVRDMWFRRSFNKLKQYFSIEEIKNCTIISDIDYSQFSFKHKNNSYPLLFDMKGKKFFDHMYIKNQIINLLTKITFIFNFFVFSVPKNVRKFSRNKSGKYTIVWKYIPFYKRVSVVMKFISKHIKFIDEIRFVNKISKTFKALDTDFKNNFVWQRKNFTYAFIFKNHRQSLMKSFQTLR